MFQIAARAANENHFPRIKCVVVRYFKMPTARVPRRLRRNSVAPLKTMAWKRSRDAPDNGRRWVRQRGTKTRRVLQYREFAALLAAISPYWTVHDSSRGPVPAFFFASCRSTSLFLPFASAFALLARWKSGPPMPLAVHRCHGHVHAIATSESHAHRLSDEFQLSGTPPLSMKRGCTAGFDATHRGERVTRYRALPDSIAALNPFPIAEPAFSLSLSLSFSRSVGSTLTRGSRSGWYKESQKWVYKLGNAGM